MLYLKKQKIMLRYLVNELGYGFILWGPNHRINLNGHKRRPWKWEDLLLKARRPREGRIMGLGQDGVNYRNNLCWVLWTPTWRRVARIGGGVTLLALLISFIISTLIVWCKGISTKTSWFTLEESIPVPFSFYSPFPFEEFLCFPPSTCC